MCAADALGRALPSISVGIRLAADSRISDYARPWSRDRRDQLTAVGCAVGRHRSGCTNARRPVLTDLGRDRLRDAAGPRASESPSPFVVVPGTANGLAPNISDENG